MGKSLVPVLSLGAICAITSWAGLHFTGYPFTWHHLLLLFYFTAVTGLLLLWMERSVDRINVFVRRFMGGLVLKLMGSLVVLFILLRTSAKESHGALAAVFGALYFVFLAFSTVRLSRMLRSAKR